MNMSLKIERINNHVDNLYRSQRIITGVMEAGVMEMVVLVLMMKINCREMKIAVEEMRIRTSEI